MDRCSYVTYMCVSLLSFQYFCKYKTKSNFETETEACGRTDVLMQHMSPFLSFNTIFCPHPLFFELDDVNAQLQKSLS